MGLACLEQLKTELPLQVFTWIQHHQGLQRERGINIVGWEALLEFKAGKWQDSPPSRGSTLISVASGSWSFSASQVSVISHIQDLTPKEVRAASHRDLATLPS